MRASSTARSTRPDRLRSSIAVDEIICSTYAASVIRITLGLVFAALLTPCVSAQSCDPKTVDLRHANLPASVKNDIVSALEKELLKEFAPVLSDSPELRDNTRSGCTSFPKLARSACVILVTPGPAYPRLGGAVFQGNADIWLFRMVGDHATLILSGFGSVIGAIPNSYHHGMLDFEFAFTEPHSSSESIERYRFNGERYVFHDCHVEDDGPKRPCERD